MRPLALSDSQLDNHHADRRSRSIEHAHSYWAAWIQWQARGLWALDASVRSAFSLDSAVGGKHEVSEGCPFFVEQHLKSFRLAMP